MGDKELAGAKEEIKIMWLQHTCLRKTGTLGHCLSFWQDSHVSCFHGSYSLVEKAAVQVQKSASFQIALLQVEALC